MAERASILLVEDDELDALLLRKQLPVRSGRCAVTHVSRLAELAGHEPGSFDCALLDLNLPDGRGVETVERVLAWAPTLPVVVMSGLDDNEVALDAVRAGAQDYLVKGKYNPEMLLRVIQYAIERRQTLTQLEVARSREQRAINELRERFAATRRLLEANPDAILVVDAGGVVQFANPAAVALFDHEARSLVGHPFGLPILSRGTTTEVEIRRSGGAMTVARMRVAPVDWEDGAQASLIFLIDITAEKEAEAARQAKLAMNEEVRRHREAAAEALRESEQRYRALIDASLDMIAICDIDGRYQFANPSWLQTLGYTKYELGGIRTLDIVATDSLPACLDAWDQAVNGYPARDVSATLLTRTGTRVQVEATFVPRYENEQVTLIQTFMRDVTERVEAERARREKDAAEAANRAKSQFLASMSHEIRTPMNAVMAMTDLVLKSELTAQQRRDMEMVRSSADALLGVINDILDFSKIEAGKLTLEHIAFDLEQVVHETLCTLAISAFSKGVELVFDISDETPRRVVGDPVRLRQVLVNLVGNAIKFTDAGHVAVSIEPYRDLRGVLAFRVEDTGCGIPPDKQQTIFGAFEQADTSTTRRYGGTGLGLAITKRIITMMGGDLWLESTPEVGSTFSFTTCLPPVEADQQPAPISLEGVRLILADAIQPTRSILARALRHAGAALIEIDSAADSLDLLMNSRADDMPGLVVASDCLEDGTGLDLAEMIQRRPGIESTQTIFMQSTREDISPARQAELRMPAIFAKPVRPSELVSAIAVALGLASPNERTPDSLDAVGVSARVLLVDDNRINRIVGARVLELLGHRLEAVTGGDEAVKRFEQTLHNGHERFDVILMDLEMPGTDGLEATRQIRALEAERGEARTPILAVSAHAMAGVNNECIAAGMDGYLAKPIREPALRHALTPLLARPANTAAAADRAAEPDSPDPPEDPAERPTPAPSQEEEASPWQIPAGEEDLVRELAGMFIEDSPAMIQAVSDAIESGDTTQVHRSAHSLKGAVANFPPHPAYDAMKAVEYAGREDDLPRAKIAHKRALAELERFCRQLEKYVETPKCSEH